LKRKLPVLHRQNYKYSVVITKKIFLVKFYLVTVRGKNKNRVAGKVIPATPKIGNLSETGFL